MMGNNDDGIINLINIVAWHNCVNNISIGDDICGKQSSKYCDIDGVFIPIKVVVHSDRGLIQREEDEMRGLFKSLGSSNFVDLFELAKSLSLVDWPICENLCSMMKFVIREKYDFVKISLDRKNTILRKSIRIGKIRF